MLQTAAQRDREGELADRVGAVWDCTLRAFPAFSPIDWYAERQRRIVGLAELKTRRHVRGTYATVHVALRKWQALAQAEAALGVRGVFVIAWTDALGWASVWTLARHATGIVLGGRTDRGLANDVEPMLDVALEAFAPLGGGS